MIRTLTFSRGFSMRNIIVKMGHETSIEGLNPSNHRVMIPFRDLATVKTIFEFRKKSFELVLDLSEFIILKDTDIQNLELAMYYGIWMISIKMNSSKEFIEQISAIIQRSNSRPLLVGLIDDSVIKDNKGSIPTSNANNFNGYISSDNNLLEVRTKFGGSPVLISNSTPVNGRSQITPEYTIISYSQLLHSEELLEESI